MIDALLRGLGLRTGRATSPHVESMTERISIDGEPLSHERFVEVYAEVAPYAEIVDRSGEHPVSFFEFITAMQFAAFADAPVDAAVIEVGMGGRLGRDQRRRRLGRRRDADRRRPRASTSATARPTSPQEKSGIIKAGSFAVMAQQRWSVAEVLLSRAAEVGATVAREGLEFGIARANPRRRRPGRHPAGARRRLRRHLLAAARRPPGAERGVRARRGRGLRRGQGARRRARRRPGARGVRGGRPRPAGSRWCGGRRRSSSTPRTTRTARGPRPTRSQEAFTLLAADRGRRRDGRQGRRRAARGLRAGDERPSSARRTPRRGRCAAETLADDRARRLRRGPGRGRPPARRRDRAGGRAGRGGRRRRHRAGAAVACS